MNKIKVLILFGGCSEEYNISIKSAKEIANHIDKEKYEPIYVGITKSGDWKLCKSPCTEWETGDCRSVLISPDKKTHGLIIFEGDTFQVMRIDVVFPVLHGKSGEDGVLQGLLELSGIPYVGCDVQSSALCMDKSLTYTIVKSAGIATPNFVIKYHGEHTNYDNISYPAFVKPARSGSSFGVTKVNNRDELNFAIETARLYDNKILIEEAIPGIEVGCAVLGNGSDLIVGEVDQITLSHGIFRIHQEKEPERGSENAVFTVPANIPEVKYKELQATAKRIYKTLGCKGLARVDMFLQESGRIVLNEVNTLPGFTSYSRYPRMMVAAGITVAELIDRLILLALGDEIYGDGICIFR